MNDAGSAAARGDDQRHRRRPDLQRPGAAQPALLRGVASTAHELGLDDHLDSPDRQQRPGLHRAEHGAGADRRDHLGRGARADVRQHRRVRPVRADDVRAGPAPHPGVHGLPVAGARASSRPTSSWTRSRLSRSTRRRAPAEVHGNIIFEDVVFGYPGGQKILERPLVLDQGGRDGRAGRRRSAPGSRRSSTCCCASSIRRRADRPGRPRHLQR